jgi:methylmalonyl-CoA/ethylmalonyl-CoA epimerase
MAEVLTGIMQVAVIAKDIERATAFYRDKLGLRFLFNAPNMAFFDCGGIRIYVDANPGSTPGGGSIYFKTDDIERAHQTFKARGVEIHQAPGVIARLPDRDVWLMWVRDSEDNLIGVMHEAVKSAA